MNKRYDSIVVTGAGGMLGRAIADALRARGLSPHAFARAELDITNTAALQEVFERHEPTLFLNCAAHTKVDRCETEPELADAINGHAVGAIARLCRQHGTILVHYSTDFIFDGTSSRPYRVDDTPNPLSTYGRSKLLGERLLQDNAPAHWLIARTAWVYGQGGSNFPRIIVERARAGHQLEVVDDEVGSPTFTADLANATLALLDGGHDGIVHITNAGQVNRYEYAKRILSTFGVEARITPISTATWLEKRPNQARRPAHSVLDSSSLSDRLGGPLRRWEAALEDFRSQVDRAGF